MLTEPARPLGIQAPETSPLRRKCRRAMVARVAGMANGSEQPIVLGRRPAWMWRIDRCSITTRALENPFYDRRILDARDHP